MRADLALTDDLRTILAAAPPTAAQLVCAVIKHGHNQGARLLASFRIDLPEPDTHLSGSTALPPFEEVDRLLDAAAAVAAELGDPAVAPEHIVIAGADERFDSIHAASFRLLGTNPTLLREQLRRLRAGRTDLLEPVVDEAFADEVEAALHALADERRS